MSRPDLLQGRARNCDLRTSNMSQKQWPCSRVIFSSRSLHRQPTATVRWDAVRIHRLAMEHYLVCGPAGLRLRFPGSKNRRDRRLRFTWTREYRPGRLWMPVKSLGQDLNCFDVRRYSCYSPRGSVVNTFNLYTQYPPRNHASSEDVQQGKLEPISFRPGRDSPGMTMLPIDFDWNDMMNAATITTDPT